MCGSSGRGSGRVLGTRRIGNLAHDGFRLEVAVGAGGDLDVISVKDLGHGSQVAGEVSLCALGDTSSTPADKNKLGETRIGVLDLDKGELDSALAEVLNQLGELAIWRIISILGRRVQSARKGSSMGRVPPVL